MRPPEWLQNLIQRITTCLEPFDDGSPVGCHISLQPEGWEATLFVSRIEILGGEFDGESHPGPFLLDVAGTLRAFDHVERCWWQPFSVAPDDDLGPHLSIEGRQAGEPVWVRIAAEQPAPIESGRVANVKSGRIERRW
jgi:hypothetical protein